MLESLVKCGAFDFLGRERTELFECIEESLAGASAAHRDRAAGQVSLFDDLPAAPAQRASRSVVAWTEHEKMSFEKELLGFYVSGHPLDPYAALLSNGSYQTIVSLAEMEDRAQFRIAGAITQVDRKFTKKEGKPFAVVFLEDLTGTLEVVLWNEVYVKVSDALMLGRVIAIQGTLDKRDESVRATAQKVKVLTPAHTNGSNGEPAALQTDMPVVLRFPSGISPLELRGVRDLLASSPGRRVVVLQFERDDGAPVEIAAGNDCRIDLTPELQQKLQAWLAAA
jgi:DNA polymerase-3 subunit alpha